MDEGRGEDIGKKNCTFVRCMNIGLHRIICRMALLVVLALMIYPGRGVSQSRGSMTGGNHGNSRTQNGYGQQSRFPGDEEDDEEGDGLKKDTTTKKRKPKKPLESYFFDDSLRAQHNFKWTIDLYKNNVAIHSIDTAINLFQADYPYLQNDVGSAYLGNLGGAAVPLNYFTRPVYRNWEFAEAFDVYYYTPSRAPFYNVKKPFTQLSYIMSGQTRRFEENFAITHAQNISPSSGFNIDYKSRGTRGMYGPNQAQNTRDKDLSIGFSHTGKKYTVHAGYIYNGVNMRETGGLKDDRMITDTVMDIPENIEMNLIGARTQIRNNTFYLVQSYGIPLKKLTDDDFSIADRSSLFVGLSTEYTRIAKKYTDTKEGSGDFYDNWYVNPVSSNDSIFESLFSNRAFIQIQPWDRDAVIGVIDAGVALDNHRYYQFGMDQYLAGPSKAVSKTEFYAYGSIKGKLKKYIDWGGDFSMHPMGYRSGDMSLGGDISLSAYVKGHPATLSGNIRHEIRSPGYWTENLFSNHFYWSNSFSKETETRLGAKLEVPVFNLELGGWQSVVTNKIYYDADAISAQSDGSVSVSGLYVRKDFRIGGFHLNNRVLLQWSTAQEVVPVPLASVFCSYYLEFTAVKDVLRIQVGLDGRYNTQYYAYGYMPATAQFYNQREKQLGNYVMVDAFANAKWKRMRILLKLQHLNEDMIGERNYFQILHYPLNKRMFKIGFSWAFYD